MVQVPECIVCLQPYDDFRHVPRVLSCGHSFCDLCLTQLQSAWQPKSNSTKDPPSSSSSGAGAVIRCPECSHRTRLPMGGQQALPKNVELLRLLPSLVADEEAGEEAAAAAGGSSGEGGGGAADRGDRDREFEVAVIANKQAIRQKKQQEAASNHDRTNIIDGSRRARAIHGKGKEAESSSKPNYSSREGSPGPAAGSRSNTTGTSSWAVPCDVFSPDFDGANVMKSWLLPEDVITLKAFEGGSPVIQSAGRELLRGEVNLERDRSSSSSSSSYRVPVTMLSLDVDTHHHSQPTSDESSSSDALARAWKCLHRDVKVELLVLFRSSMLCRRLCRVFGLWMTSSNSSKLYLVSQFCTHNNTVSAAAGAAWEGITQGLHIEAAAAPSDVESSPEKPFPEKSESAENGSHEMEGTASNGLKLSQTRAKGISSAGALVQRWIAVGLALCEVLWEVHSQGLILGLFSPNCLVVDMFGNLLIDVNKALVERSSLQDETAVHTSGRTRFGETGHGGGGQVGAQQQQPDTQNLRNCWQYMSPEALLASRVNLAENRPPRVEAEAEAEAVPAASETGELSLSGNNDPHKIQQGRLASKGDVWSLGCLILELVTGRPPFHGLSYPDVFRKVVMEREEPGDGLSLGHSLEEQEQAFSNLVVKCFAYDPDQRPDLKEIWRDLVALAPSNVIPPGRSVPELATDGIDGRYWMLSLPGFVRDGYLDSAHGRQAVEVQEEKSQARLDRPRQNTYGSMSTDVREGQQPRGLEEMGLLEGHQDYVTALAICGDYLLSASSDKTIRVWSLEQGELQKTLAGGHTALVTAMAVDQDTCRCFSGDTSARICAWQLESDNDDSNSSSEPLTSSWQDHEDWRYTGVMALAVSRDGVLYSGSGDRTIKAWSLQNFGLLSTMEGHNGLVSTLLIDGELLYSGSWDGTIRVWWRADHSSVAILGDGPRPNPALGGVRTMCMSDSFLFSGLESGAVQIWKDDECLATVRAHRMVVNALLVEGDFLYTGSWDQHIKAWKLDEILSDPSPTLAKNCNAALSSLISDGEKLYAGLSDKAIKIFTLPGDTWASPVEMLRS